MKLIRFPGRNDWPKLTSRPVYDFAEVKSRVTLILEQVKNKGDKALHYFCKKFDSVEVDKFIVNQKEIKNAGNNLSKELKEAISIAINNVWIFHSTQIPTSEKTETYPGVHCWQKIVPIEKVGLYVPGGSAPLFSSLIMLGVPAKLAGCKEIIVCTPPGADGEIHPAILFVAKLLEIDRLFLIGGAQAIGAMAYGTDTVPRVYKIFGPGNQYVTAAKQLISLEGTAVDLPAGPSEVAILADKKANADFVAADLLAQAEHGPDSQVLFITTDEKLLHRVTSAIGTQLNVLPRKKTAELSLKNSLAILIRNQKEALDLINMYAPEHLIIATENACELCNDIVNAGSVFIGNYTPVSAGDYASGTNHTLPTNAYARNYSGVSLTSFTKNITFQEMSLNGLRALGPHIKVLAEAEYMQAHANSISIRLEKLK